MRELSLHILDLVENAASAGADRIHIRIVDSARANRISIQVADNGHGFKEITADQALHPFTTTSPGKRTGLGLALLSDAAKRCNGGVAINKGLGRGSVIQAWFERDHWDRAPVGDLKATLMVAAAGFPACSIETDHLTDAG